MQLAKHYSASGFTTEKLKMPLLPDQTTIRKDKGASWFANRIITAPTPAKPHKEYKIEPGEDLSEIIRSVEPGGVIVLAKGTYPIQSTLLIDKPLTIRAADRTNKPLILFKREKPENMVTIADNGELIIENIVFDGVLEPGKVLAKAGISTAADMIKPYTLTVDGCEFQNFGEGNFFAIKGTKATFAKSVIIRNCIFSNLSGDAINYAAEKDDIGRYNVDDMLIEKTLLHLDLEEINQLFLIYPFNKIKRVWLDYLVPQAEYLYTLNRFFAWYYFKAKKPDAYIKSMATRHLNKMFA